MQNSIAGSINHQKVHKEAIHDKTEHKAEGEKYLRFGDYILLRGSEQPYRYLSGRSVFEESIYLLEQMPIEIESSSGILEYQGLSELLFVVYPNYYYEASKAYDKLQLSISDRQIKRENNTITNSSDYFVKEESLIGKNSAKFETLRKRKDAEADINQKRVVEFRGQFVTIGAEIQLYHVYSGSFIQATRDKSEDDQNLFHVKLTKNPSSATHFEVKINPYLNFKKEGEKVGFDEQIFFENQKYHSVLKILQTQEPLPHPTNPTLTFFGETNIPLTSNQKKQIQEEEAAVLEYKNIKNELNNIPILEQMPGFTRRKAGHGKAMKERIDTLQAVFVKKPNLNDEKAREIQWGDFVRIKHILRSNKKTSNIHIESNICGYFPNAYAVTREIDHIDDGLQSVCDVFQVLPEQLTQFGQFVEFDNSDYGKSNMRLRHLLTGRYLQLIDDELKLSKTFDEELVDSRKQAADSKNRKSQKPIVKQQSLVGNQNLLTQMSQTSAVNNETEVIQTKPSIKEQGTVSMGKEIMEQCMEESKKNTRLIILNIGRDEPHLQTSTAFQIKNDEEMFAKIYEDELELNSQKKDRVLEKNVSKQKNVHKEINEKYTSLPTDLCNDNYFKPQFQQSSSLHRKYYQILRDEVEGDFFFFEFVPEIVIQDYNSVNCLLNPLIELCEQMPNSKFEKTILDAAIMNLNLLGLWLCDSPIEIVKEKVRVDQITSSPLLRKQTMIREMGILDILLKIVLHSYRHQQLRIDAIDNNNQMYQFMQILIEILMKACIKHQANSIYLIQWYQLFKLIILDREVIMEFKFDILVSQLFLDTNIMVSFEKDLRQIVSEIKYDDINLNALNLLLSFCRYNPNRKKNKFEEICEMIVEDESIRTNIFKQFKATITGQIYLQIVGENGEVITPFSRDLEVTQKNLYYYTLQVANLSVELSKGGPSIMLEYIKQLYDVRICLTIIKNEEMPPACRAIFLNILKESYLMNDFKYMITETLPSLVKIKNRADFESTMVQSLFQKFKESACLKYFCDFEEQDDGIKGIEDNNVGNSFRVNLKIIISNFLNGFIQLTFKEQNDTKEQSNEVSQLAEAILSLLLFILKRGFYQMKEIVLLESTIYNLLLEVYAIRKIKSKDRGVEKEKQVGGVKVTSYIHIPNTVANWVTIAIDILSYLETIRLDYLLEQIHQDNAYNKYFGTQEEQHEDIEIFAPNESSLIEERTAKLSEYLEEEQQRRDINNTFVLTEILLFDNLKLKGKVVELIHKQFQAKKRYFGSLNKILTVDSHNSQLYFSLQELYYILHFSLIDIQFSKSSQLYQNHVNLNKMEEAFKDLIAFLFDENPPDDLVELASLDLQDGDVRANQVKPSINTHQGGNIFQFDADEVPISDMGAKSLSRFGQEDGILLDDKKKKEEIELTKYKTEKKSNQPSLKTLEIEGKDDKTHIIENEEKNDLNNLKENQSQEEKLKLKSKNMSSTAGKAMKNGGIEGSRIMYSIMDTHYIEISTMYQNQKILRNMNYHELIIGILLAFGQNVAEKNNGEYFKKRNSIARDCLMGLIFFTLQNDENQELVLNHKQYPDLIESIFDLNQVDGILELSFILISQIYKDNYSILLTLGSHFAKQGRFVMKCLFSHFFDQATKQDKTFCIYFFQFLKLFFTLHGKTIPQNQEILLKIFQDETISRKSQIQSIIIEAINSTCYAYMNPIRFKQDSKEEDFIIKIPQEAILLQYMLLTFRQLAKGAGLPVNTMVRTFFSLEDISTILRFTTWDPSLKKEALDFLVEVYLNNKSIETNELLEIQGIIQNVLIKDIHYYQEFTKLDHKNAKNLNWKCKGESLNLFEGKNPFGSFRYLIQMNYLYGIEYYMMNSIIPCIQLYIRKLPEVLSDQQYQIMSTIDAISQELQKYWEKEDETWKLMIEGKFEEKNLLDGNGIGIASALVGKQDSFLIAGQLKEFIRKKYDKKPEFTEEQKRIKKTDTIKAAEKSLNNLLLTEKYQRILTKQQNVVTSYNQEAAFTLARQNRQQDIFSKSFIDNEQEGELEVLVSTLIEIKIKESAKFRAIIESLIDVLSNEELEIEVRMISMKMLRKISNYKSDSKVNESIQHDLIQMGFLKYLCDVISIEADPVMKLEYIRGMVDFMEESNAEIQDSFFKYLQHDTDNKFLIGINKYLASNFHQSKNSQELLLEKGQHQIHFRRILLLKQEMCLQTLELLRLSSENHYRQMQNFLRVQTDQFGKRKANNLNMINQLAGMFERYRKTEMQSEDFQMGIKILDTLIELIQGPCEENQLALCHTNLLENLEDMQYDLSRKKKLKANFLRARSEFNQRTIVLMRSLFEGNFNRQITQKVAMYIDVNLMIEAIADNYEQYAEYSKKIKNVHKGLLEMLKNKGIKSDLEEQNQEDPINLDDINAKQELVRVFSTQPQSSEQIYENSQSLMNSKQIPLIPPPPSPLALPLKVSSQFNSQFYEKAQSVINEAFERYMLIKNLKFLDREFQKKYEESLEFLLNKNTNPGHEDVRKALNFMESNTRSIEIINQRDQIQKVYFRVPHVTSYLSTTTKYKFLEEVNRDGSSEKLTGLLSEEKNFREEMMHFLKLNALGVYFNLTYLSFTRNLNLTIAFIINIFLLIKVFQESDAGITISSIFQYTNLAIAALVFAFWLVFEMPLEFRKATVMYEFLIQKIQLMEKQIGTYSIEKSWHIATMKFKIFLIKVKFIIQTCFFESHMVYLLIYLLFSLGGIIWNDLFYSLLLLDIIERSQTLQNVIKAVTKNGIQLIMTAILGIFLVFIYSMIGYFSPTLKSTLLFFSEEDQPNVCQNPVQCFTIFLNNGLRSGGGIGDILLQPNQDESNSYVGRFFFDLSFDIIIIIIMLNILFGIIIDTFGELRENRQAKEQDMKNMCFICNLERGEFENQRINFEKHITHQHNIWNYIYFLIHLHFKNPSDFDGIESYVYDKYLVQDISWFPVGTSLHLKQANEEDDEEEGDNQGLAQDNE